VQNIIKALRSGTDVSPHKTRMACDVLRVSIHSLQKLRGSNAGK
jgi:hypothetical protein